MGYDFHVVRTKHWLDAAKLPITKADVDALVMPDTELAWSRTDFVEMRDDGGGNTRYHAICWNGEPVFVWYRGEITCKNPSNEHIVKLVQMADALGARVVGDDGNGTSSTAAPSSRPRTTSD